MAVLSGNSAHAVPVLEPAAKPSRLAHAIATILLKAIGTTAVVAITGAWITFLIRSAIWIVDRL